MVQIQNSKEQLDPNCISGRWTKLRLPPQIAKVFTKDFLIAYFNDPFRTIFEVILSLRNLYIPIKECIALSPRGLVLLKVDLPKIKVPQNGHYNSKLYNKSSPIFHPFYLKLERSRKRRELESEGRLTEPKGKR